MRFVVFSSVALCILTPPPPILLRSILSSTDSADEDPEVEVDAPAGGNGGIASTVRWVHQTKGFFRLYSRTTFISFPSIIILFVAPVNSMAHRRMCVFFFITPFHQASVSVRPDWRRVEEVDLLKISKGTSPLSGLVDNTPPKAVEDLLWCGFLDQYNDQYDRVSTRTPAPLKRVETREFYPVTTTDDPVIEKLAIEGKGTVFATDAILAHLMTCPRSVYPWDIVVQKLPTGALFFDKRDASQFDYLTVHETSNSPPAPARDNSNEAELVNSPERLSLEATMINQNFTQQILRSSKYRTKFDLPNPFWDEDDNDGMEPASVAYRYRKFDLGDGVSIVARTELHGLAKDRQKADTSKIVTNVSANRKKKVKDVNPLDDAPEGDQYMVSDVDF